MKEPVVTLRQWKEDDFDLFASMNADVDVMRYFPSLLTREKSRVFFDGARQVIEDRGWGLWAVEVDGRFAGFTGLAVPTFEAPFMPCVEIGWRFRKEFWGQGVAFKAAQQAERYAFEVLQLDQLVSFTTAENGRSRRLMERLGFRHDPLDDFQHPSLPEEHPLRPHVLYRKGR